MGTGLGTQRKINMTNILIYQLTKTQFQVTPANLRIKALIFQGFFFSDIYCSSKFSNPTTKKIKVIF